MQRMKIYTDVERLISHPLSHQPCQWQLSSTQNSPQASFTKFMPETVSFALVPLPVRQPRVL